MAYALRAGTRVTKANIPVTPVTQEAVFQLTDDVYQSITHPNARFEGGSRLAFVKGQKITQTQLDAAFATAEFTSITPATGPAAGGTNVVIKGKNLAGTAGVTIGGAAATNFKVVSETTITCTTPAGTAGAKPVVITDDSGNVTANNAYTYS